MAEQAAGTEQIVFDDKQQQFINDLIAKKQGEAAQLVRTELATTKTQIEELNTQLTTAKADLAKAKTPGSKAAAGDEVEALKAHIAEIKAAGATSAQEIERLRQAAAASAQEADKSKNETINVRKEIAIAQAAQPVGFVDLNVITKLTTEYVRWDSTKNTFVVYGDNGQERLNASFNPMSLAEFYTEYAAKNPYLVRGDARPGTGSTQSQNNTGLTNNGKYEVTQIFGKGSNAALANNLARENINEYHRLKAVAKESGIIQ